MQMVTISQNVLENPKISVQILNFDWMLMIMMIMAKSHFVIRKNETNKKI